MLAIRRTVKRKQVGKVAVDTRGPFLTESTEFDAGTRKIVVELHPDHIALRHLHGKVKFPLTYDKAIAVARREHQREIQKLRKK